MQPNPNQDKPLLEVRRLKKYFPIQAGFLRRTVGQVYAVDDVSFSIPTGRTMGLVGESGCGKTTLGRCVVRAIPPTDGEIALHVDGQEIDLSRMSRKELRPVRKHFQMVFQDPYLSLNPRKTILDIVGEPLRINKIAEGEALERRVRDLVDMVGLNIKYLNRYPHAFSGGQRQRIGIARALGLNPQLIVCDEPVSALDVSIQAQIINLLKDLQAQFGLTYLFIAHDLSVVEYICDRVAVMYVGNIVETAPTEELFGKPLHPYTEALLASVPRPDPRAPSMPIVLSGEVANPANPPTGCYFHPRCRYSDGKRCVHEKPELREIRPGHHARCHYAETLELKGVMDAPVTVQDKA
jgi:peptide/nickel transport system ATP-binding protein